MTNVLKASSSEIFLETVKNYGEDIISIKDLNFNYISFNKAFLDLHNLEEDEVINKSIYDVLSKENAEKTERKYKELIRDGGSKQFSLTLEGNPQKIVRQCATLIIKDGIVKGILSISRDVTIEESLKAQLIEANSKFNTLLKHIPMIIYMKDKNGNYMTSSEYGKNFITNRMDPYAENLKIELTATAESIKEEDDFVINTQQTLSSEKTATDTKGIVHWYKVVKAPILSEQDNNGGLITIVQNIDNEKQNAEQQELFLAELTHDMKNPILAQISTLELLYKGTFGELTTKQKEILGITIESSKYMKDLLYSILKSYKYDNGALKLEYNSFEIDSLVKECMNEAFALAEEKNIKLIYNSLLTDTDKNIIADKKHLRIVISNMLNNGLSYGYRDKDYIITTEKKDNNIILTFENISPAIPEDIKNNIFDKYVTGASKYKKVGFGLGLYISKKIVDEHKGLIYITTDGDKNKFTVEIPIKPE